MKHILRQMTQLQRVRILMPVAFILSGALASSCYSPSSQDKPAGQWATACSEPTVLDIGTTGNAILGINQNQINAEVSLEKTVKGYQLKFVKPGELGPGGNAIHWESISTSEVIGTLRLANPKESFLTWKGLFDAQSKTRVWQKEADFWQDGKEIKLVKCQ